jgi:hypothetical protein
LLIKKLIIKNNIKKLIIDKIISDMATLNLKALELNNLCLITKEKNKIKPEIPEIIIIFKINKLFLKNIR